MTKFQDSSFSIHYQGSVFSFKFLKYYHDLTKEYFPNLSENTYVVAQIFCLLSYRLQTLGTCLMFIL